MRIAVLVYGRLNKCVEHYDVVLSLRVEIILKNNIDFNVSYRS